MFSTKRCKTKDCTRLGSLKYISSASKNFYCVTSWLSSFVFGLYPDTVFCWKVLTKAWRLRITVAVTFSALLLQFIIQYDSKQMSSVYSRSLRKDGMVCWTPSCPSDKALLYLYTVHTYVEFCNSSYSFIRKTPPALRTQNTPSKSTKIA